MEMRRTRSPYPNYYQHWGGHLPFPPDDCPCLSFSFVDRESGIRWLDLGICASNKCHRAPCRRRRSYTTDECLREAKRLSIVRAEMRGDI